MFVLSIWVGTLFLSLPLLGANSCYHSDLPLGTSLFSLIIFRDNGNLTEQHTNKKKNNHFNCLSHKIEVLAKWSQLSNEKTLSYG